VDKRGKKWSDMTPQQRAGTVVLGAIQIVLLVVAIVDMARRPPELVRGKKRFWAPVLLINGIGPLAYLVFGRLDAPAEGAVRAERPDLSPVTSAVGG